MMSLKLHIHKCILISQHMRYNHSLMILGYVKYIINKVIDHTIIMYVHVN